MIFGDNFKAPWCSQLFFFKYLVNLGILFPPPRGSWGVNISKAVEQKSIWIATTYLHECVSLLPKRSQEHDAFTGEIFQTQSTRKYIKYTELDISNMATTIKNHNLYVMWLNFENIISKSRWFPTNMSNRHVVFVLKKNIWRVSRPIFRFANVPLCSNGPLLQVVAFGVG